MQFIPRRKLTSHKVLTVFSILLWLMVIPSSFLLQENIQVKEYYFVDKYGNIYEMNNNPLIMSSILFSIVIIMASISSCYCGCCNCCETLVEETSVHSRLEQTQMV